MTEYYKGIIHAHTTISYDGHLNYEQMRKFMMDKGLNFVAITEHIEGLEQSDINNIISECQKHSDNKFLFIPGIEMDCFYIYFLGIKDTPVDFTTNKSIFNSLYKVSDMLVFSHPIKSKFKPVQWLMDKYDGIEVLNTKHDGQHYFRPQSMSLLKKLLKKRQNLVALAGMDFHNTQNYTPIHMELTVKGPLNQHFVLNCLKTNQFQVMRGNIPFSTYNSLQKFLYSLRIYIMDFAHYIHLKLTNAGFKVPKALKSKIRRLMEG